MTNPLFSTYRTGENRITSSTMSVFERVGLALVRELLETATGSGGELRAVVFENQVVTDGSVPDSRISARFTWWFETKTVSGTYGAEGPGRDQVRRHSQLLAGEPEACLFVLTPDPARPVWFDQLDGLAEGTGDQILWLSFRDLANAVSAVISDPARVVGEQTRFLLSELVALYESDGLLTNDDTVVVAARRAWPEYQLTSAYVCQPDRAFREGLTHFGFYALGAIQPLVPRIKAHHPTVLFSPDEAASRRRDGQVVLADLIESLLARNERTEGESYGVLLLSGPDDPETVRLAHPIINDTLSVTGKPFAWTMGQRYTSLSKLISGVSLTSEL